MTALELLKKARATISAREHWTRHHMYTGGAYCAYGALLAHKGPGLPQPFCAAKEALHETLVSRDLEDSIVKFNDSHYHKEVLDLFDQTIARLEEHEGDLVLPTTDKAEDLALEAV